jgi:predicted DCC family thiol-disulfide oxidoreductase YuxK
MSERAVLLYDDGCRLCRFAARSVLRLDREETLAVLPLHDPEAARLLEPLPADERLASWRLVRPGGSLVGYGAGVVPLARSLRLTRPLGRVLEAMPPRLLEAQYELIARNRRRLGRLVPDGPAPRRFP